MVETGEFPLGLLSFLSFALSIIAAVMAIDMYKLLRTGEFGKTWRLLIIATVMFALLQVLRLARILDFTAIDYANLAQVVELCFVITLAYAFYSQRKVFTDNERRYTDKRDPGERLNHESHVLGDADNSLDYEEDVPIHRRDVILEPPASDERGEGRIQYVGSDINRPPSHR